MDTPIAPGVLASCTITNQSGLVEFDKHPERFQLFPLPREVYNYGNTATIASQASPVDDKVWMMRMDVGVR